MNGHFSVKSLLFYGTMIGGVVILFRVVSWYGETNLKAPPNVAGNYLSKQPLPGCPESTRFVLTIQQSGIYLYGGLQLVEASQASTPQNTTASPQEDLPLRGLFAQQISLTGSTRLPATCALADATIGSRTQTASRQIPITVQGQISGAKTTTLVGKMTLGSLDLPEFTAIREQSNSQSNNPH